MSEYAGPEGIWHLTNIDMALTENQSPISCLRLHQRSIRSLQPEERKRRGHLRWPTQNRDKLWTLSLFRRAKDQLLLPRRRFAEYFIYIPGTLGSRRRSPGHSPLSADLLLSDCGPCSPHFQPLITLCSLLFLPAEEPLSCQSDTN